MLHIVVCSTADSWDVPGFIRSPKATFDRLLEEDTTRRAWVEDPVIASAIQEVDQVPRLEGETMYTSLLEYGIRPQDLSTGVKNLTLCKFYNGVNRGAMMGPNCYPFLGRICACKEVYMTVTTPFDLTDEFFAYSAIKVGNDGRVYATLKDWNKSSPDLTFFDQKLKREWLQRW